VRLLLVVTDSEALAEFERAFLTDARRGFTVVPKVWGRGRTGLRAGDRVHPGGSSLFFTVVEDDDLAGAIAFVKDVRDRARAGETTRIYVTPVEEVA
jgi:hypothetical protein